MTRPKIPMCHLIQIGHEIVEASQAAGPRAQESQMFFEVAFEPISLKDVSNQAIAIFIVIKKLLRNLGD